MNDKTINASHLQLVDLLSEKIFHDLGNSANIISLIAEETEKETELKEACNDMINHIKLLRNIFTDPEITENHITMFKKYLDARNKEISLNFIDNSYTSSSQKEHKMLLFLIFIASGILKSKGEISIETGKNLIKIVILGDINNKAKITQDTFHGKNKSLNIHNIIPHICHLFAIHNDFKLELYLKSDNHIYITCKKQRF